MSSHRTAIGRWSRYLSGLALAAGLIAVAVPAISGTALAGASAVILSVPALSLLGLVALWILGLALHTITLTAALPTLTHRRALALSLSGSAVANVLPLGGAAGMALNYRMIRGWGFGRSQFASYTVVTNVWDVLAKLALPLLVLPLVLVGLGPIPGHLVIGGTAAVAALSVVLGVLISALRSDAGAARVGRALDRSTNWVLSRCGSTRRMSFVPFLITTAAECRDVIAQRWHRLSLGMLLYTGALLALLGACLTLTGAGVAPAVVLVGFTFERLLTLIPITPGGAGVVEVGLAGTLLLLGGNPAGVVAGVLLYRLLTFALEIPVGGATLAGWWWAGRRSLQPAARPFLIGRAS